MSLLQLRTTLSIAAGLCAPPMRGTLVGFRTVFCMPACLPGRTNICCRGESCEAGSVIPFDILSVMCYYLNFTPPLFLLHLLASIFLALLLLPLFCADTTSFRVCLVGTSTTILHATH